MVNNMGESFEHLSRISQDINIEDKYHIGKSSSLIDKYGRLPSFKREMNTSIYTEEPKRYKLGNTQFEVLFPFIKEYDEYLNHFTSFNRKEIVVEFPVFVNFLLENDEETFNEIMYGEKRTYVHAYRVRPLLDLISDYLEKLNAKTGRAVTGKEAHEKLPKDIKAVISKFINQNPSYLTELWRVFLINVAILNIKSVILCGEYATKKLKGNQREVIPLKFIPKLGSELQIMCMNEILTLDIVKSRIITGEFGCDYNSKLLVGSLEAEELEEILNYRLDGEPIHIPEIADKFGYTQQRYSEAEQAILSYSASSEDTLAQCNEYLDGLIDYVDSVGALCSELEFINEKGNCVVLDYELE